MIRSQTELMAVARKVLDLEKVDPDDLMDLGAHGVYHAMGGDAREVLHQLVKSGPVWDGDLISKSGRDTLLDLRLASKVCVNGKQGFQAANYVGWAVLMAGTKGAALVDAA